MDDIVQVLQALKDLLFEAPSQSFFAGLPYQCYRRCLSLAVSRRDEVVDYVLVMCFNLLLNLPQTFLLDCHGLPCVTVVGEQDSSETAEA
jgi:hypothetical protein